MVNILSCSRYKFAGDIPLVRNRLHKIIRLSDPGSEKLAVTDEAVLKWSEGKTIKKVIVGPGRLVNIAVG